MQTNHLKQRYKKIFANLPDKSLILIESNSTFTRNNDVNYPYRQYSNTIYLTNCLEPNTFTAIFNLNGEIKKHMACHNFNPTKAQWEGGWTYPEKANEVYGTDYATSIEEWPKHLINILSQVAIVWLSNAPISETILRKIKKENKHLKFTIKNITPLLNKLRLVKDDYEIAMIKKACNISANAHIHTMQQCQPSWREDHIEAEFFAKGRAQGAKQLAYPTIAASANNACTLHYNQNDSPLQGLVLLDAGMEYCGYASDITRTFPASGKFTSQEKDLYDIVLRAQESAIDAIKPGVSWQDLDSIAQKIILQGCLDLEIFKPNSIKTSELLRMIFPHSLGHHLGLDVHDGSVKTKPHLVTGNVITIEPGIYLNQNNPYIKDEWRKIGIRIEDDILVTNTGHVNLSKHAPKSVSAIETLMGQ